MTRPRVAMHRLEELVRLHRMGTGAHEVARLLRMGANQERKYRKALELAGLLAGPVDALPSLEELKRAVGEGCPARPAPQQSSSAEPWTTAVEAMLKKGAQPKAIYDRLRLENEGFETSLWAVKRLCRRLRRAQPVRPEDVVIRVETGPGELAQVDFGYVGRLYDPAAGVERKAWVFVLVLCYSRHQFARVVFDQKTETWLQLHVEAFEVLGGVVDTIAPDNLKAAVLRAAFGLGDNPSLNRSYRELAKHYGFKIEPAPRLDPSWKGKVEAGVKYAKHNFFRPRQGELADIVVANRELDRWVREIAGERAHGTTGRHPIEMFETEERALLMEVPSKRFEAVVWKQARVHPDSRFVFEGRLYPVPWRFIGKNIWVRATPASVEAHCDDVRIATHERGKPVPPEVVDAYLPKERAQLRHRQRSFWLERADRLGESVGRYVREVFDCDSVLSMVRPVQCIVTLLEKYPNERANAACERASHYGNYSYPGVRDILRKALDREPLPVAIAPAPGRLDQARYARTPRELLQLPLEFNHEPN